MNKKRLLPIFFLVLLLLAFIPNVVAQEALDNILQEGVLPVYEANQRGIDFIIALVLLLGLVKFALIRSKWNEGDPGFKLVWIATSVALAVGFSWAQQKANFTIGGIFSQFVIIVAVVFLIFLIYNLIKGTENKHGLLLTSITYLVIYNIASIAAPTIFNAIGGTLSTLLGILNIVFLISFIVGMLSFISGLGLPKIKRGEGSASAGEKNIIGKLWGSTLGRGAEKAQKENQEVLDTLYGSISGDIKDGEDAKNRLADLSNKVVKMQQITNKAKDTISDHISELETYFKDSYNKKIKNGEVLLDSLEKNINEEIKRWGGSDIKKTIESIIKQVIPKEPRKASSLATKFVGTYKVTIDSFLQGELQLINNNKLIFGKINKLVNTLLLDLSYARIAIANKDVRVFVSNIKNSITTINDINDDLAVIASSVNEIKTKMTSEIATEQALRDKVEEYLIKLGRKI